MIRQIINRIFNKIAMICPGGYSLRPNIHRFRGAHIGKNVWISQYVYIDELHPEAVTIGKNCTIGLRTSIFTHFYWGPRQSTGGFKNVTIEDNVFIGPHSLILPGVRIGEGAVIKGGSVITRNVPPRTLFGFPDCSPIARVTVPLTNEFSYMEFMQGLRPIRSSRKKK